MQFRTMYDQHDRVRANPGRDSMPEYQLRFDDKGKAFMDEVGLIDCYSEIQSHALSVDINVILQRFQSGDINALSRTQGVYMDAVGAPTTMSEMLNLIISGEEQFNKLPLEIRERFNYSYTEWIAAMSDLSEFARLMGVDSDASEASEKEVTEDAES